MSYKIPFQFFEGLPLRFPYLYFDKEITAQADSGVQVKWTVSTEVFRENGKGKNQYKIGDPQADYCD